MPSLRPGRLVHDVRDMPYIYKGEITTIPQVKGSERMEAIIGDEENAKALRHTYANRSSALRAARSEWKKIQRGARHSATTWREGGRS